MTRFATEPAGGDIAVAIVEAPEPAEIEAMWRGLEARAQASFFQSWPWIDCWLSETGLRPGLIVARRGGDIVGLGLLHKTAETRRFVSLPSLYLHETGDPQIDAIFIEYNGFLTEASHQKDISSACLRHLIEAGAAREGPWHWSELHLSGVSEDLVDSIADTGVHYRLRSRRSCPYVELAKLRRERTAYLSALSRNTRYQVRRSMRLYEEFGALQADRARSVEEALTYLEELKGLHQEYWQSRGRPGAFAKPFFGRFHQRLIGAAFPAGGVDLIRVCAGRKPIGYLYNFIHDGRVMSYQTGFTYEDDARYKPGLVSHTLAIESYLAAGLHTYDFMAGDNQLKSSLSTCRHDMYWITVQRDRLLFKIENFARSLRERVS